MNMDLQAWGWKTLGFTEKKKVGMEKANMKDLKILVKALQLCWPLHPKSKVNRMKQIKVNWFLVIYLDIQKI